MENAVHLQEIIGTDNKKNPFFSVSKHPDQPRKLWVYFGAALLETVEDDRNHPTFKMLVASVTSRAISNESIRPSLGETADVVPGSIRE